jgi:hypothetical protein
MGLATATLGPAMTPLRGALLILGLSACGFAVARRLQTANLKWEDRLESAGLVGCSAFGGLLAHYALDREWDSMQLAVNVLIALALGGAVLLMLPSIPRKIIASLLIVFHFLGIVTAVSTVPAPNNVTPWIPSQLWIRVYRPYLQFFFLNNAYHFYSPEPGPPEWLWFLVTYQNGEKEWVKVPDREHDLLMMHNTRMLSVSAAGTDNFSRPRADQPDNPPLMQWSALLERRRLEGERMHIPLFNDPGYPVPPPPAQYSEPVWEYTKEMCASFAKHVAQTHPWRGSPDNTVKTVKVYHLRHNIVEPSQLAQRFDPWDPSLFQVWFEGEFSPDGDPLSVERDENGTIVSQDPFLYWQLPIFRITVDKKPAPAGTPDAQVEWVDCFTQHAGLSPWDESKTEKKPQ